MDILRKELNALYAAQHLEYEHLDEAVLHDCQAKIASMTAVSNACYVITDASADTCFIHAGWLGRLLGISNDARFYAEHHSSDEDIIYNRIHPEDLVEKRMLEYDFFQHIDLLAGDEKLKYIATCRIRIRNRKDEYVYIHNSTQILHPSPDGKIWLILCCYALSPEQTPSTDISPRIINHYTGEIHPLTLGERRNQVLSDREKEILRLIREGKSSKQIADALGISIHTVNRHRQNILEKLSVGNSHEAITAASAMRLL